MKKGERPQLSAEEVKAQRAKKQEQKAARVAAALEKKNREAAAAGGVGAKSGKPPSHTPKSLLSPALTPAHGPASAAAAAPPLSLGERRESISVTGDKKSKGKEGTTKRHAPMLQFDDPKKVASFDKKAVVVRTAIAKAVPLFSHLPQYEHESSLSLKLQVGFGSEEIHPAILRVGLQYASGAISGSNSRCVAMLTAFRQVIGDYATPPFKVLRDDLLSKLKPLVRFLIDARPPQSISMGNAIRYLKLQISRIEPSLPEAAAKSKLQQAIDSFIAERIAFADEVIATHAVSKINDEDVILTYACSHVVEMSLRRAHQQGKRFRLIIVDARPKREGKELMKRLVKEGIRCTYVLLNAVSYVIREVNKVIMGAAALLSNGSVISRVGSALVALHAHRNNVPLLICCETYKFHERVQLDSIGFNELGDPDELLVADEQSGNSMSDSLSEWRDMANLKLLNLMYDLTPVTFVTMVITEVGMIPPTSVPVILREYSAKDTGEAQE